MTYRTDATATLARSESGDPIAADRVKGTAVRDRAGEKLGSVRNFMVGKRSGRVDHAVLSFGGLFGLGERYSPLPWDVLDYDTGQGGYVVDLDKSKPDGAPDYESGDEPAYDRTYGERVYGYYGVPFWGPSRPSSSTRGHKALRSFLVKAVESTQQPSLCV